MHTITVDAPDISRAWLDACTKLSEIPGKKAFHTVVRIARPLQEDPHLRAELDRLRGARTKPPLYPIDTVVNTLFPTKLAATCSTHEELAHRYQSLYPRLREVRRNAHGTYFGRLVAYPGTPDKPEPVDQLARVIRRLDKLRSSAKWSAVYEAGTAHVTDDDETWEEPQAAAQGIEAGIRAAALDTQTLDFPCLSHCSFQLDGATNTVHLAAYYRSHYMFDRAYGNYLALGHLCAWVARHAGLTPGTLTVMSGCARLDCTKSELGTLQHALTAPLFGLGA
ncbi:hypothetical protein P8A22_37890 (plasmid) [Streptomyces laculatispora]|uniref:Thymidylate synthase n=1 Tax=Streptomyces laculatispora TaxID=887464 RepID=A0ABY9IF68_9ACTN|nr:hypothetical protein [Streptomyces laculatispora]WLQ45602.1 hypothetical protein P8A22_37890 [Streptomyces laculatispora]